MGLFSKIFKSIKNIARKALPIVARVAPFIPALAPFSPFIQAAGTLGGRTTGRVPSPGTRLDVGPPIRGGATTSAFGRAVGAGFGPPIRNPAFGPGRATIPRITFGENQQIDASIQLARAALGRGPIAGPSPAVLPIPRPGQTSPIFAGGIGSMAGLGTLIGTLGRGIFGGGARAGGGALITGGAAGNLVLSSTGRILSVITASGARIGRKRAVAIAKFLGLNAGAAALGIGIVELAQMTVDETGRPRRRRGITARDFATTRRTMTKIKSMHAMLPTRGTSRRSPAHVRTAAITHG